APVILALGLQLGGPPGNAIEDDFTRADQSGWGRSTNTAGLPDVDWGADGAGKAYVNIASNTGTYAYPGAVNEGGFASAGATTYNGGDSLVQFSVSATGQVAPFVAQNACGDGSCYYAARLGTSTGALEI